MRRFSSALIRSVGTGRPAGIPSRIATRPRPCDSPAVVNRNVIVAPVAQGRGAPVARVAVALVARVAVAPVARVAVAPVARVAVAPVARVAVAPVARVAAEAAARPCRRSGLAPAYGPTPGREVPRA